MFDGHISMNILNYWSDLINHKMHTSQYYINHTSLVIQFWVCTLPSRFLLLVPIETVWIWGYCCQCIWKGTKGQQECCCVGCCICCKCGISECGRWATTGSLLSCRPESIYTLSIHHLLASVLDQRWCYGLIKWWHQ